MEQPRLGLPLMSRGVASVALRTAPRSSSSRRLAANGSAWAVQRASERRSRRLAPASPSIGAPISSLTARGPGSPPPVRLGSSTVPAGAAVGAPWKLLPSAAGFGYNPRTR